MRHMKAVLASGLMASLCACSPQQDVAEDPSLDTPTSQTGVEDRTPVDIFDADAFLDAASPEQRAILGEIRDIDANLAPTDPNAIIAAVASARTKAEGVLPESHPAWAALTNLEATAQFYLGDPAKAYEGLQKAYEEFKLAGHHPSDESIQTLGSLVTIARMRGEPEQSEAYLEEQRIAVEAVQGPSSMDMSQILYNKGAIAFSRNDYALAIDWMKQAVAMSTAEHDPDRPEQVERVVGQTTSLAALYDRTNAPGQAVEYNRRASDLAAARLPAGQPTRLFAQNNYASMLSNQGRFAEARTILVDVLEQRRNDPDPESREMGITQHSLGFALMKLGDEEAAETHLVEARRLFQQGEGQGEPLRATLSLAVLAETADRTGRYETARERWIEADREFIELSGEENTERVPVLLSLARNAVKQGAKDEAQRFAVSAVSIAEARSMTDHPFALQGRILAGLNNADARQAAIRDALSISTRETAAARLAPDYDPGRLSIYHPALDVAAGLSLRDGRIDDALEAMQLRHLDEVAENAIAARLRRDTDDADSLRTLQDARQRYTELDRQYLAALAAGSDALSDAAKARNEQLATVRQLLEQMDSHALNWDATRSDAVRSRLADGQGLLILHLGDVFPAAALITQDTTIHAPIAATHVELIEHIRALRMSVDITSTGDDGLDSAANLYRTLFPDNLQDALSELSDLLIYAPGDGLSVPFAALRDESGTWLGEAKGLRVLPVLSNLGTGQPISERARFIGIGDPTLSPPPAGQVSENQTPDDQASPDPTYMSAIASFGPGILMRGGMGDAAAIRSLPSLPATRQELNTVAQFFGKRRSKVLLAADATEADVRESGFEDYNVISFATHALVSGEIPGLKEPALVLTPPDGEATSTRNDGLLTQSEITEYDIDGGWVVLSACNTAGARTLGAPGLSGLTSAFLYSGADTLMVSHWPVRDDAAAFLSTRTIAGAAKGLSPEQALRQAMSDLRASDLPGADHPRIWAPFVIVGR